jgi:uncharacterized protein (DUF433 family)
LQGGDPEVSSVELARCSAERAIYTESIGKDELSLRRRLISDSDVMTAMNEIVSTDDVLGGAPRIEGRRIGVHHIAKRVVDAGEQPEQVAADYSLDIADVHRALAYYYDNAGEMRSVQAERQSIPDDCSVVRGPDDLDTTAQSEPEA